MTTEEAIGIILKQKEDHVEGSPVDEAFCKAIEALKAVFWENKAKQTMTNAEWLISKGIKFSDVRMNMRQQRYGGGYYAECRSTKEKLGQIVGAEKWNGDEIDVHSAFRYWLDLEHEDYKAPEAILTGEERGYLKQVIAPFRDRVNRISKHVDGDSNGEEMFIFIELNCGDSASLPNFFTRDNLFKGMEPWKEYTLQELGL